MLLQLLLIPFEDVTRQSLAAIYAALRNPGLRAPDTGIQTLINGVQQSQVAPATAHAHGLQTNNQASTQVQVGGNHISPGVSSVGARVGQAAAQGLTSVPTLTPTGDNISGALNRNDGNANPSAAQPTIINASTPPFPPGLNPKAPPFSIGNSHSVQEGGKHNQSCYCPTLG